MKKRRPSGKMDKLQSLEQQNSVFGKKFFFLLHLLFFFFGKPIHHFIKDSPHLKC